MALQSMDDKLLGEKAQNYCSSDEESEEEVVESLTEENPALVPPTPKWDGQAIQTGPKGVIEDWRRYKQLETETRERDKREKDELCRKLAMTCKSFREENDDNKDEGDSSDDEQFMEWYKQKRILEIQQKYASRWEKVAFGDIVELDQSNFIEAVENEKEFVTVIIHVYDDDTPACATVNGCMKILSSKYKTVKFCKINVKVANMSSNFIENGLPTIIVYKGNLLIGNYVRISDILGEDFFAPDLEEFLIGYGVLPSKHEITQNT